MATNLYYHCWFVGGRTAKGSPLPCTVLIHKLKISTPIILRVFNGKFTGELNLKPTTFIHHWKLKAEITSCVPALKTSSLKAIKGQLNKKYTLTTCQIDRPTMKLWLVSWEFHKCGRHRMYLFKWLSHGNKDVDKPATISMKAIRHQSSWGLMLVGLGNFRSSANESNQWLLAIQVCRAVSSSEQSASTKTRPMLMQIPSNLPVMGK